MAWMGQDTGHECGGAVEDAKLCQGWDCESTQHSVLWDLACTWSVTLAVTDGSPGRVTQVQKRALIL